MSINNSELEESKSGVDKNGNNGSGSFTTNGAGRVPEVQLTVPPWDKGIIKAVIILYLI